MKQTELHTNKRAARSLSLSTRIAPPLMEKCGAHSCSDRFLKAGLIALLALLLCGAAIGAAGAAEADLADDEFTPDEVAAATDVTIAFDANGGSGAMDSQEVTIPEGQTEVPVLLNECTFTPPSEDKKFIGWKVKESSPAVYYTDRQIVKVTENVVLLAQWASVTPWTGAAITRAGYYQLTDNVNTSGIQITKAPVVIDLNGHVLNGNGSNAVIIVSPDGNLAVTDSNSAAVHHFTGTHEEQSRSFGDVLLPCQKLELH